MYKAVIDQGNTRCKVGIFSKMGILEEVHITQTFQEAIDYINSKSIKIVITNHKTETEIYPDFNIYYLNHLFKLPFLNLDKKPETLGLDRIASLAAAAILFPNQNTLIFDVGTCITIDFLNENNAYNGGNISPGLKMRYKAMHHFTSKLPLSTVENIFPKMGNTSMSAIANGAFYGIVNELNGYITDFKKDYQNLNIIICGGDTLHFDKQLKTEIFAKPNLVLEGLYQLLLLNENK